MKISKRHLLWANLVLLALVAYFGAATVSGGIAARLTPPLNVQLKPAPPPIERAENRPESYYQAVVKRDIFNSVQPVVEKPPEPPKQTELRLKLWGIVVHHEAPDSSYAVIEDLTNRRQDLYRVGDTVASAATIKRVEWDQVVLDRSGAEEILKLEQPSGLPGAVPMPAVASAAAASPLAPASKPGGRAGAAPTPKSQTETAQSDSIQQTGDGEYTIAQSEVDSALDNMSQLFTQIRAVPHFQGGESVGFRLFAIRQNSIFDKIGLRNGDIIQSVNGTNISDPAQAMAIFQNLRGQSAYTVNILRNKEAKSLSYNINK